MRILVTGGTGLIGAASVTELLSRGHSVRIVSRNAKEDAGRWPAGVESWEADISDLGGMRGSAQDCDVVLHIAGIVAESPPEVTFSRINVDGTRNTLGEAERAGVGRFVYLSSLGAESGKSAYHLSKREGELLVEKFRGGWIILRPGNVYGPGDEVMSVLLGMTRTSPAIPVIDGGSDQFQPIWFHDLARAIVSAVERPDLHGHTLELAGEDVTSIDELLDRFSAITGKAPMRIPVPGVLARAGVAIAELAGIELPVNQSQLTMLREGSFIQTPGANALTGIFQVRPTTLENGLRQLAESQLEQLPESGVGSLERKRIWADIQNSALSAEELFSTLCLNFDEVTPASIDAGVEPQSRSVIEEGATLTMALPLRGNVQVRAHDVTDTGATLVTLVGHPLAGAAQFITEQRGGHLRFEVKVHERAANVADWLAMKTVGGFLQSRTWHGLVERMIRESGGAAAAGVQHESETLDDQQATRVEEWLRNLTMKRRGAAPVPAQDPVVVSP